VRKLTILGSTGSVGANTLDVVARHPERFRVVALSAHRQVDSLYRQCVKFGPEFAVMLDCNSAEELEHKLAAAGAATRVLSGTLALQQIAELPQVDTVMAAIVGAAGLLPTWAAVRAGKRVLLANKEALVMAGNLFIEAVKTSGARLLPIDSEHNAVYQSLPRDFDGDLARAGVSRILLTASGGPFRNTSLDALEHVTPTQACAHPNWVMGRKISVDSATMMNKGLEVIEARWLFNAHPEQIKVVLHPQSVIHSMVEYVDGSIIAQLSSPDMRAPIAYCLDHPERIEGGVKSLDLFELGALEFRAPDLERYPCLALGYQALQRGGSAPAVLNAANEVAVEHFLAGKIPFPAIPRIIEHVLGELESHPLASLDEVLQCDAEARAMAEEWIASGCGAAERSTRVA
jgi:1-deoxy-D-xylulose-5-phosphate reductoisomerase